MLTVCFDGAGREADHPLVVVAGFASFAGVWRDFEIRWQERLRQDGLPYFHAGEFSQSTGVFKVGWKNDETRRRRLCQDLMSVIEACGLRKFGTVIPVEIHNSIDHALRKRLLLDAYVQGARSTVATFNNYAKSIGVNRNVKYVFEKGDSEDALRKRFADDDLNDPCFTWKSEHVDRKGIIHYGFLGLQAAGWIAYEYFLDMKRRDDPSHRIRQMRWPCQQFERLQGKMEIQSEDAAKGNEAMMRISEDTRYLGSLKYKP